MERQERHPLRGLLIAQFFGAFNDNAWKLFVGFLAVRQATAGADRAQVEAATQEQMTVAFAVITVPLMLFSLPAGVLADRLSKRSLIVAMKAVEVLLMAAGATALLVNPAGGIAALCILGLMGAQSAFFSPAKYGILPEILPHHRLSAGNGQLELWTFLAIIAGTVAGGIILDAVGELTWLGGLVLTALAVAGFAAARRVPHVAPARSEGGLGATIRSGWKAMRADRVLRLSVIGSIFYWVMASMLGVVTLVYARVQLDLPDSYAGMPLAAFAVGVGAGSVLAGKLSASKVEYGLIPLGAIGLSVLTLIFGIAGPETTGTLILMGFMGVSSGLIVVPLHALLQWRSPKDRRGAVIALANVFVFAGILAGTLGAQALSSLGLYSREIFAAASLILLAGTVWAIRLLPDALLRLVLILLTHSVYRLKVQGRQNVPEEGGALLVPNHVSFVDGLFLLATVDRPIRFLVESAYFRHPFLKPFMKALGAISISSSGGPKVVLKALREAGDRIDNGDVVCIFAEGQITRTGMLLPFRRGLDRIVKGRSANIIPVHLDRVWGSIFSWAGGHFLRKFPRRIPYPVTVSYGTPLPPGTAIEEVRSAVQELGEAAWEVRKSDSRPLHRSFIRSVRRRPFQMIFADHSRPRISRFKALAGAIAVARALRGSWGDQRRVGIFLPPSVASALANLASALSGRASVNLNYTAGLAGLESAAAQAGLKTVVTSRVFLEKANLELPGGLERIWLEDVAQRIRWTDRLTAFALALAAPHRFLERACGANAPATVDDIVTIIFSSGSTGEPKGVLLSHFNIAANIEALAQVMRVHAGDRILGILPHFHSFGYMALWFVANNSLGCAFHPNPLDAAAVGELVQRYRLSILIATPTFLQIYMRRCTPAQFGSLRLVVTGAEKLPERVATAFEDYFGIRPLEGYGTTECSPVVTVSSLDYRAPGFFQPGSRRGSVGQPLPGVSVRIVDPESEFDPEASRPLPHSAPGMLVVRGPNVMQGYLGRDDLTAKVLKDGWYVTGDIAAMDEDGFLRITDRLSRFSKIGGEMVPHGKVEEALHRAAGSDAQIFAVTAVEDERKGERLAVLHTLGENEIPALVAKLADLGLPNLYIPRVEQFVKVDALPLLGTGKLDLRAIKRTAAEALVSSK